MGLFALKENFGLPCWVNLKPGTRAHIFPSYWNQVNQCDKVMWPISMFSQPFFLLRQFWWKIPSQINIRRTNIALQNMIKKSWTEKSNFKGDKLDVNRGVKFSKVHSIFWSEKNLQVIKYGFKFCSNHILLSLNTFTFLVTSHTTDMHIIPCR